MLSLCYVFSFMKLLILDVRCMASSVLYVRLDVSDYENAALLNLDLIYFFMWDKPILDIG